MAADADTPDGELTEKTAKATASPDNTDDASSLASVEESEPMAVDGEAEDYDAAAAEESDDVSDDVAPVEASTSHVRLAAAVGSLMVAALAAITGWLGFHAYQSHQADAQRRMFLQVGRQCALNLTTIDWQHADADVQRLVDSATGEFFDQFSKRKQPFIEVIKKTKATSVGTITEAGVESLSGDKAQVLVAVSIKTSNVGSQDLPPREWRVRISVEKSGGEAKISNVSFVQ